MSVIEIVLSVYLAGFIFVNGWIVWFCTKEMKDDGGLFPWKEYFAVTALFALLWPFWIVYAVVTET